ncbi:MAG: DUF6438 domain-containing protein [Candidatus Eremiobacteraeota bacterium]|nr:DUF6438 domain-containing protein [Candidatus Eremiobacteraeota bacterium]
MRGVGLIVVLTAVVLAAGVAFVFAEFPSKSDISEIDFTRSGCFGHCPAYEVTFRSNGCAVYSGHSDTLLIGRYTGVVVFQRLAHLMESHHFQTLQDQYAMNVVDAPGMTLRIVTPSKTKTVETRNAGGVPIEFEELGNIIDGFIFTTHWVSDDPKKQPQTGDHWPLPWEVVPGCK